MRALRDSGAADGRSFQAALQAGSKSDLSVMASLGALRDAMQLRARRELDPLMSGAWADGALQVMRLESEAKALNQDRGQTIAAALAIAAPLARAAGA